MTEKGSCEKLRWGLVQRGKGGHGALAALTTEGEQQLAQATIHDHDKVFVVRQLSKVFVNQF